MKLRLVASLLVVVLCLFVMPVTASANATIYVPDDYSTIQAAVDAAADGDTIIVRDGSYTENIDVTKQLIIQSEDGADSTTVTAANSDDYIFYVTTDSVTISGFTVTGATGEKKAGIYLGDGADHCTISNNTVSNNYYGIHLDASSNNTLQNNTCYSNSNEGIFLLSSCNNNTIDNNISYSNGAHGGIFVWKSCNNNTITNNECHSNLDHGIKLHTSDNNFVANNICSNNEWSGIYLNTSSNNTVENNTCEGGTGEGDGIMVTSSSENNRLINNICSNWGAGIKVNTSNNNMLIDNICSNNEWCGIYLVSSNYNIVAENTCSDNEAGIVVRDSSYNRFSNNLILNINVGNIHGQGIWLEGDSSYNEISWNIISLNGYGVRVSGKNPIGNKIEQNNIAENTCSGVTNESSSEVDATLNWWGVQSGPSSAGPGSWWFSRGDTVSDHIVYSPWLDAPYPDGKPLSESEAPKGINWWLVIGTAAAIVIIGSLIYFFIRRRKEA